VAALQTAYGHNSSQYRVLLVNDDGSIDSSFSSAAVADNTIEALSVQPDGKILVGGFFSTFAGASRQGVVRLLADGTVDPGFAAAVTFPSSGLGVTVLRFVPADGKILIGGNFLILNNTRYPAVARLNPDGNVDSTFQPSGFSPSAGGRIGAIVLQSDNKILLGGRFTVSKDFAANHTGSQYTSLPVVRLNTDGSADQSYGCFSNLSFNTIKGLAVNADDKAVAVDTSVYRFNTDGTVDSTFHSPVLIDRTLEHFPTAFAVDVTDTGSLFVGGEFSNLQNAGDTQPTGQHFSVARLNNDGTVDSTFNTSQETMEKTSPQSFLALNDGSTLVAFGALSSYPSPAIPHNFGRLTGNGEVDLTFDPIGGYSPNDVIGPDFIVNMSTVLSDGTMFVGGTSNGFTFTDAVIRPDGTQVPNYNSDYVGMSSYAYPYRSSVLVGDPYGVEFVAPLPAGSTTYGTYGGTELQRFNADGSLDYSFSLDSRIGADAVGEYDAATRFPKNIAVGSNVLAVLENGQILFTYYGQGNQYHLVRLNADGSLDTSFREEVIQTSTFVIGGFVIPQVPMSISAPSPVFTNALELPSGKIMVVGEFTSYAGTPAHGIIRLNADGSVDTTFQPGAGAQWIQTSEAEDFHPAIDNIQLSTDGKFLVTGTFEAFNNVSLPGIASLNHDGTVDTTFVPPATRQKFDRRQTYLSRQHDGSYLLSGPYSFPGETASPSLLRINNATRFSINAINRSNASTTISFDAVAGNTYRLEYKDELTDPDWQQVSGVNDFAASATGTAQFVDSTSSLSQRAYRVRLVP
jgi:uncharacterized delta-60 repeat protein